MQAPERGKWNIRGMGGIKKSHIGRNERSRKSDFMLSGNDNRVENEAMIGGAESERSFYFSVCSCESARRRLWHHERRSASQSDGVATTKAARTGWNALVGLVPMRLSNVQQEFVVLLLALSGLASRGRKRRRSSLKKTCALGWDQETADLVLPDRRCIVRENCTNALP